MAGGSKMKNSSDGGGLDDRGEGLIEVDPPVADEIRAQPTGPCDAQASHQRAACF